MRSLRLVAVLRYCVLVALVAMLSGCGDEHVVRVADWTFRGPDGTAHPVRLPAHFDAWLPKHPAQYDLTATVTLPPELRGQALTFATPMFQSHATLTVDGVLADSLESRLGETYRSSGAQRFRIPASATADGELVLDLAVPHRYIPSGWLDLVPTLSATAEGDAAFLAVRTFNVVMPWVAVGTLFIIGLTYALITLLDERRASTGPGSREAHGWFAVQAISVGYYPFFRIGTTQLLFGAYDVCLNNVFASIAAVASVYFTHAQFSLGRPNRSWKWSLVVLIVVALFAPGPWASTKWVVPIGVLIIQGCFFWQLWTFTKLLRRTPRPTGVASFMASWILMAIFTVPENMAAVGTGEMAYGLRGAGLGIVLFTLLQMTALSREHIASLVAADHLNLELERRVTLLEMRNRENTQLTEELRRQVADRSRQLADSLARIGALPERSTRFVAGDVVAERYRVIGVLGSGGMGAVYEVERVTDARRLALKVLIGPSTGVALSRFAREAQIAAEVHHPNLVAVLDVDVSQSGALFLVMELVEGEPLYERRARFGEVAWATDVLRQIARGLSALHAAGVVHRDLKPANVLVSGGASSAPHAKISDFGVARFDTLTPTARGIPSRLAGQSERPPQSAVDPSGETMAGALSPHPATRASNPMLTQTGVLIGTPFYIAPELGRGAKDARPSSDVFSFGVIAYELLSGQLPFATPPVLDAYAHRAIAPAERLDEARFGRALSRLVARCLDVDPEVRPTAEQLVEALEQELAPVDHARAV